MHILIIGDQPLFREAVALHLRSAINDSTNIVVFEASSIKEAQGVIEYKKFELILLDVNPLGMNNFVKLPLLCKKMKDSVLVVMSNLDSTDIAKTTIQQGASGYISKSTEAREFKTAINLILSGEIYISPCILSSSGDQTSQHFTNKVKKAKLTPRQNQVLQLMTEGLPNKLIASTLNCSEGTVKLHVSAILNRLNVKNRTEAVRKTVIQAW